MKGPYLSLFFVALFFVLITHSQSTDKLGIDHLKFEKQWILKNLADDYFLNASLDGNNRNYGKHAELEKAFSLYENSLNTNYNKDVFLKSNYYDFQNNNDLELVNMIQLDINYRKSLLLAGKNFHSDILDEYEKSPEDAKNAFIKAFKNFFKTAEKFREIDFARTDNQIEALEASLDTWGGISEIIDYDNEVKAIETLIGQQNAATDKWSSAAKGHFNNVQTTSAALNTIVDEIKDLEKQLNSSISKAAYSAVGLPDLTDGIQLEDGLEFISGLENNPTLSKIIPQHRDGYYELADYFKTTNEYYEKAKRVVGIGETIDDILRKDDFDINDIIDIGTHLADGLEISSGINPDLAELSTDMKEQLSLIKKLQGFGEILNSDKEIKECIRQGKISCIDELVNAKLTTLCEGIAPEFCEYQQKWSNIKSGLTTKFGEEIKLITQADSIFKKHLDIKSGVDLIKLLEKYGGHKFSEDQQEALDIAQTLDSISKIETSSDFEYMHKLGDHIFNNLPGFEGYKGDWQDYSKKSKSLILLYQNFKNDFEADERIISILFDELDSEEKVEVEQLSREIVANSLLIKDEKIAEALFKNLLLNKPEILFQRIWNKIKNRLGPTKIGNKEELLNYLRVGWQEEKRNRSKIRFENYTGQSLRIKIYKEKNLRHRRTINLNISTKELFEIYLQTSSDEEYFLTYFIIDNLKIFKKLDGNKVNSYFRNLMAQAGKIMRDPNSTSSRTVYDLLYKQLSNSQKNDYNTFVTKVGIGTYAYLNNDKNFYDGQNPNEDFKTNVNQVQVSQDGSVESNSDFFEQAAYAALNYYFPGSGYALSALKTMGEIDGAIDEYSNLLNKLREFEKNYLETVEKRDLARNYLSVYENKKDVFESRKELASFGMRIRNLRDVQVDEALKRKRTLINMILPTLFYQSEVLRREYSILNGTMKYWTGKSLSELIMSDENYLRLAIDPDIRIYQWLDLNGVGKRTQVYDLINQWEQINSLVNSLDKSKTAIGENFGTTTILTIDNFDEILNQFGDGEKELIYPLSTNKHQFEHINKTQLLRLVLHSASFVFNHENKILSEGTGTAIELISSGKIYNPKTIFELNYNNDFNKPEKPVSLSELTLACANPNNGLAACISGSSYSEFVKNIEENPYYSYKTNFYSYPLDSEWSLRIKKGIIDLKKIKKIEIVFRYQYRKNTPIENYDFVNLIYPNLNGSASKVLDKPLYYDNGRTVVWHERSFINQEAPRKPTMSFKGQNKYTTPTSETVLYDISEK